LIFLAGVLLLALQVYQWIILAYIILTWIPRGRGEPAWLYRVREFLTMVTEPYLSVFRRLIPSVGAGGVGLDFSPILALLVIWVLGIVIRAAVGL
jgi:uncharacterized protein YggT (Ycf19 family)